MLVIEQVNCDFSGIQCRGFYCVKLYNLSQCACVHLFFFLALDMKWRKMTSFLPVSEITINGALPSPYQGHLLHEALNEATQASRRAARRGAPMRPSTLSSLPFHLSLSLSLYIYIYI